MANRFVLALVLFIVLFAIFTSCTSRGYRRSIWYSPSRSNYNNFRGGGPSWGK